MSIREIHFRKLVPATLAVVFFSWANTVYGQETDKKVQSSSSNEQTIDQVDGIFDLSLEELLAVEIVISSAARRPQSIGQASSAMYVITAEDIHQSGVTHLGDLLRLIPGMNVSHTIGFQYQVGIRGFPSFNAKRFQILLDGRSLYDAFKGGAELDFHPIFLENIERIEVIRGSGGVTWGVNAMNGVINIITKEASETKGGLIYGGIANRDTAQGVVRYGAKNGPVTWRLTVGATDDNGFGEEDHGKAFGDGLQTSLVTGRAEIEIGDRTTLTLAGGFKDSTFEIGPKS